MNGQNNFVNNQRNLRSLRAALSLAIIPADFADFADKRISVRLIILKFILSIHLIQKKIEKSV